MKRNKGFTLLELLIALVLSATILTGVYSMLDSILNTKTATEGSYYQNSLLLSARKVIKPDMLQMYKDSLNISNMTDNDILEFTTNNSIKMEKAFPVKVRYYVEDGYLIRRESAEAQNYEWSLYLMGGVEEFNVESHNGYRFTEDTDPMDTLIKVSFKVNGYPITFIAGSGHTSKTGNYEGSQW